MGTPYCELRGDAPWDDESWAWADAEGLEVEEFIGVVSQDDCVVVIVSNSGLDQEELSTKVAEFVDRFEIVDERDKREEIHGRC
ncbi:MAG: hypothetical protein WAZ18_04900 [Alphaproteobacteria bacterium]